MHRQIMENELYLDERFTKAQAWIDLLLLASHKDRTVKIRNVEIDLKPGELAYSQKTLAERWQWNRRTVRKFIDELKNQGMIHNRISKVTTVVSIINWHKYQCDAQQNEDSAQQKIAEMHNRDAQQETADSSSNGQDIDGKEHYYAPQKSTKFSESVHTNKNEEQEAHVGDKEFYKFVRELSAGCKNNGLFINENSASVKLKAAYQRYGEEKMRRCFNDVIDKALKKKTRGEKIRDLVTYGLQVIHNEYSEIAEDPGV